MINLAKITSRIKLGELCYLVTKGTTPTSVGLEFTDSGVPFLRIQNLCNRSVKLENVLYISEQTHLTLKRSIVKPKDFLITIAGTIGRVAIVPDNFPECNCNQAVAILRFDYEKLNPQYLLHWLDTPDAFGQISGRKVTATISNFSLGQIKELEIPLPPLAEQQKIASVLDAADSLRQKDQQLIEKYNALSQSLFLEMFGDPVNNLMGWDKVELATLGKISSGSTPSREVNEYYVGNIPWVKTGEVNSTKIIKTSECISEVALKNSSCKLYPAGSLIIAMYGQGKTRGQVGMLGIEATTNQACAVIPPSSNMNYDYLFMLLKLSYEDLRRLGRGGNQPNLNSGLIKSYCVISPPIALQNQFAERIQLIEAQKQLAQASLQKSEALFNSLLQRAFKGELTT